MSDDRLSVPSFVVHCAMAIRASRPPRLFGRAGGRVGARLEYDGSHLVALAVEPRRRLCADRLGGTPAGSGAARTGVAASRRGGGVAGVAESRAADAVPRNRP